MFGLVRNVFVGPFSVPTRYLTTLFISTIWQGLHHYAHFFQTFHIYYFFFLLFYFPYWLVNFPQFIFIQNYLITDFFYYHCNYTYRFCILCFLSLIALSKYLISLHFFNSFINNITNFLTLVKYHLPFPFRGFLFSFP